MGLTVYWAAPLFTQAERLWNRRCAESLSARGYSVMLPQDEAMQCIRDGRVDARAVAELCYRQAIACDVMVAVLDGADSDSGTSIEAGLRVGHGRATNIPRLVIGIRTDFRASEDEQLNAMFRLLDHVIRFPSFNENPEALCGEIDAVIRTLSS